MKIGLTGGIGSGKNFIAQIFEEYGYHTIDLDDVSRLVMQQDTECYNELIKYFSDEILLPDKSIDRKKLASIIFHDDVKKKFLEHVTHKAIFEHELKIIKQILMTDNKANILSHAALMVESGGYKRYDKLIVIYTDIETQIKRITNRDNCDELTAKTIINNQLPFDEKMKVADIIIDNSKDETHARDEVARTVNLLKLMQHGDKHHTTKK